MSTGSPPPEALPAVTPKVRNLELAGRLKREGGGDGLVELALTHLGAALAEFQADPPTVPCADSVHTVVLCLSAGPRVAREFVGMRGVEVLLSVLDGGKARCDPNLPSLGLLCAAVEPVAMDRLLTPEIYRPFTDQIVNGSTAGALVCVQALLHLLALYGALRQAHGAVLDEDHRPKQSASTTTAPDLLAALRAADMHATALVGYLDPIRDLLRLTLTTLPAQHVTILRDGIVPLFAGAHVTAISDAMMDSCCKSPLMWHPGGVCTVMARLLSRVLSFPAGATYIRAESQTLGTARANAIGRDMTFKKRVAPSKANDPRAADENDWQQISRAHRLSLRDKTPADVFAKTIDYLQAVCTEDRPVRPVLASWVGTDAGGRLTGSHLSTLVERATRNGESVYGNMLFLVLRGKTELRSCREVLSRVVGSTDALGPTQTEARVAHLLTGEDPPKGDPSLPLQVYLEACAVGDLSVWRDRLDQLVNYLGSATAVECARRGEEMNEKNVEDWVKPMELLGLMESMATDTRARGVHPPVNSPLDPGMSDLAGLVASRLEIVCPNGKTNAQLLWIRIGTMLMTMIASWAGHLARYQGNGDRWAEGIVAVHCALVTHPLYSAAVVRGEVVGLCDNDDQVIKKLFLRGCNREMCRAVASMLLVRPRFFEAILESRREACGSELMVLIGSVLSSIVIQPKAIDTCRIPGRAASSRALVEPDLQLVRDVLAAVTRDLKALDSTPAMENAIRTALTVEGTTQAHLRLVYFLRMVLGGHQGFSSSMCTNALQALGSLAAEAVGRRDHSSTNHIFSVLTRVITDPYAKLSMVRRWDTFKRKEVLAAILQCSPSSGDFLHTAAPAVLQFLGRICNENITLAPRQALSEAGVARMLQDDKFGILCARISINVLRCFTHDCQAYQAVKAALKILLALLLRRGFGHHCVARALYALRDAHSKAAFPVVTQLWHVLAGLIRDDPEADFRLVGELLEASLQGLNECCNAKPWLAGALVRCLVGSSDVYKGHESPVTSARKIMEKIKNIVDTQHMRRHLEKVSTQFHVVEALHEDEAALGASTLPEDDLDELGELPELQYEDSMWGLWNEWRAPWMGHDFDGAPRAVLELTLQQGLAKTNGFDLPNVVDLSGEDGEDLDVEPRDALPAPVQELKKDPYDDSDYATDEDEVLTKRERVERRKSMFATQPRLKSGSVVDPLEVEFGKEVSSYKNTVSKLFRDSYGERSTPIDRSERTIIKDEPSVRRADEGPPWDRRFKHEHREESRASEFEGSSRGKRKRAREPSARGDNSSRRPPSSTDRYRRYYDDRRN